MFHTKTLSGEVKSERWDNLLSFCATKSEHMHDMTMDLVRTQCEENCKSRYIT